MERSQENLTRAGDLKVRVQFAAQHEGVAQIARHLTAHLTENGAFADDARARVLIDIDLMGLPRPETAPVRRSPDEPALYPVRLTRSRIFLAPSPGRTAARARRALSGAGQLSASRTNGRH